MRPITKFLMVLMAIVLLYIVIFIGVTEYNYTKDVNENNEKKAIISGFVYGMVYQESTHILNQSIIYESNNSGIINCFNNQSENDTNMTLCLDYALQDMKRVEYP